MSSEASIQQYLAEVLVALLPVYRSANSPQRSATSSPWPAKPGPAAPRQARRILEQDVFFVHKA